MITRMRKSLTLKWMIFPILLVTIPLTLVALGILQIYHLDLKGSFIAIEGIILIIAVLFSLFFARQLTLPIKRLSKEMEEGVNTGRMHLVDAMDMARIAYWEFDLKTGQFIFDDAFYTLYGTSAEAEGGYRMAAEDYFQRFIHPDDLPIARQSAEKSLQAPGPEYISQLEHRAIHRNGEIRYFLVRSRTLKDASGNITRSFGANQDITERKRMEEELAQKTRELETLYDLSLLINQSLDIDTVFHTALEKALSVTGFEMGAIYLLNEKGDILERKSDIGLTPTIFEDGKVLKYGEGVSGNAIRLKQPVIVSIDKYSSYRKVPVLIEEGIQTLVGFPLQAKGKIVGTITLLSHSPRELSKREINLLESIGYQIGIALENAKLFTNVAKAKSEWETTFDAVTEGIIIIDKNYRIIHANKDAHERIGLEPKDLIGKKCFEAFEQNDKLCEGCCVSETFVTKKSAFLERENKYTKRLIRLRAFPIFDESGESVGAVELISDITEEKRLEMEKEVINNVNKILASSLDIKELIKAVHAALNRVMDSERMSITLFDENGEGFRIFALEKYYAKEWIKGVVYPQKGTNLKRVAETGLPIINMDTAESDSWTSKKLLREGIRSSLLFPLQYKGKIIGTMNFNSKEVNHFSENHFDFLSPIAPGMAISIQNALLFEETKKRLNELTILYEIMKISASSLNLDQMLREIINSLRAFFKFEALGILLVDENTKRLFPHPASYNELTMRKIGKLGLCVGKGITGWVVEKGEPLLVNDVSKDSRYVCGDESTCSEICVPLKMGQKVIGVIDFAEQNIERLFGG